MELSADPSIPPANGKCLLLGLPAELRLMIWELALTPSPRGLTYRYEKVAASYDPSQVYRKCRLFSAQLEDVDKQEAYHDVFQVRRLCKQTYTETQGMHLNLCDIIIVGGALGDSQRSQQLAKFQFNTLLGHCLRSTWQNIRKVTLQCNFEMHHVKPYVVPASNTTATLTVPMAFYIELPPLVAEFVRQTRTATLYIVIPELRNDAPPQRYVIAGYWVLGSIRGKEVPCPLIDQDLISFLPNFFNHPLHYVDQHYALPNIRYVPPIGEQFKKQELLKWLESMNHPRETVDFWMEEVESWYNSGL